MITREMLEEEARAIFLFIYGENFDRWYNFCNEIREKRKDGLGVNQSMEATTMLVTSLTNNGYPWRFVVYRSELDTLKKLGENLVRASENLGKNFVENRALFDDQMVALKGLGEGLIQMVEHYKEREPSDE